MSKYHPSRIYVYPEFKKKLELMAVEKNKSVISLTRELAEDDYDKLKQNFAMSWKKKNDKNIFRF